VKNVAVLFNNAWKLAFPKNRFDLAICGFMGWYDCFDFNTLNFTRVDEKGKEIYRVLREGSKFVCCSWEAQDDLAWMEQAMLRHHPALLEDAEYLQQRPIGMAYEKAEGYKIIFHAAGLRDIQISEEIAEFVSTDEEEWWRQMSSVGWESILKRIERDDTKEYQGIKDAIFNDLQRYKQSDGIHFSKTVFYISGVK
jgi:ubiquinone/menaquinone biosynthesis C-methylase UbiE